MRFRLELLAVGVFAAIIGCGGDSATGTVTTTTAPTSSSTSGGTSSGSTTFSLSAVVGTYTGTFSGSNTQHQTYTGTGTGSIQSSGAAEFAYNAYTSAGNTGVNYNRTFMGTVSSTGVFTGQIAIAPYGGGTLTYYPATGTVTEASSTQITVSVTWAWPYSNGGTFETSTENWTLTVQST